MTQQTGKSFRGFAQMSFERRREVAGMGGRSAHAQGKAHKFTPEEARAAGHKSAALMNRDREYMAAIGLKGVAARKAKEGSK